MNLILTGRPFTRPFTISFGKRRHLALFVAGTVLSLGSLLGFAFAMGYAVAELPPDVRTSIESLQAEIASQREAVAEAEAQSEHHLNALAIQLGRLQAQSMRLNALGQRLAEISEISEGEFDFSEAPALGGPELADQAASLDANEFTLAMTNVGQRLEQQERQLVLLEELLLDRSLDDRLTPAGRPVTDGSWISSGFGKRIDPFSGRPAWHNGVDFAGHAGTEIRSVADGVITWAGDRYDFGQMVEIDHGNGYITRYAHNSEVLVEVGQQVAADQPIAKMGATGRANAPHLHFEVLRDGKHVNPIKYVKSKRDRS